MVRAQIDLIGQSKFGRGNSELIGLGRFLEYLVAARILEFESQLVFGRRLVVGAKERQRAHMDRLARLVDWLFGRKKNGNFVIQPHRLGKLGRTDRGIHNIAQLVTAD